jgi:hypothetical protein
MKKEHKEFFATEKEFLAFDNKAVKKVQTAS